MIKNHNIIYTKFSRCLKFVNLNSDYASFFYSSLIKNVSILLQSSYSFLKKKKLVQLKSSDYVVNLSNNKLSVVTFNPKYWKLFNTLSVYTTSKDPFSILKIIPSDASVDIIEVYKKVRPFPFFLGWLSLFDYSSSTSFEFKLEHILRWFVDTWYPFINGFFFFKTTKSNQFFFFGLYRQFLEGAESALNAIAVNSVRLTETHITFKSNEIEDNVYYFSTFNYGFSTYNFMSAGLFGHTKKKHKRSFKVSDTVNPVIEKNFFEFTKLHKIDFFFLYLKGYFKQITSILYCFQNILKEKLYILKGKFRYLKKQKRSYYRRLKAHASHFKLSPSDYINNLRHSWSLYRHCISYLSSSEPKLVDHLLFVDILDLENPKLVEASEVGKYLNRQFICVSKARSLPNLPSSIYLKRIPMNLRRYIGTGTGTFRYSKIIKKLVFSKLFGNMHSKSQSDVKYNNKHYNKHNNKHYNNYNNKPYNYYNNKHNNKHYNKHNNNYNNKPYNKSNNKHNYNSKKVDQNYGSNKSVTTTDSNQTENDIDMELVLDMVTKQKLKPQSVLDEEANYQKSPTYIDDLVKLLTAKKAKESINEPIKKRKILILNRAKLNYKLQSLLNFKFWYRKYKSWSHYKYIYKKRDIKASDIKRSLYRAFHLSKNFISEYKILLDLNHQLRYFITSFPRSFLVVDITSYAFNGCRRTRHYRRNRTY